MSKLTLVTFISKAINSSKEVKATKLDSTLKAIINNSKRLGYSESPYIVEYLNLLRVVYYLKRLKYFNDTKYIYTLGKCLSFPTLSLILTLY